MKITFSTIKSGEIFCDDFLCLTDLNGTIELNICKQQAELLLYMHLMEQENQVWLVCLIQK